MRGVEVEVKLTPEQIGQAFADLASDDQVRVFVAIAAAAESWETIPGVQWQTIGEALMGETGATEAARNVVREIAFGMRASDPPVPSTELVQALYDKVGAVIPSLREDELHALFQLADVAARASTASLAVERWKSAASRAASASLISLPEAEIDILPRLAEAVIEQRKRASRFSNERDLARKDRDSYAAACLQKDELITKIAKERDELQASRSDLQASSRELQESEGRARAEVAALRDVVDGSRKSRDMALDRARSAEEECEELRRGLAEIVKRLASLGTPPP